MRYKYIYICRYTLEFEIYLDYLTQRLSFYTVQPPPTHTQISGPYNFPRHNYRFFKLYKEKMETNATFSIFWGIGIQHCLKGNVSITFHVFLLFFFIYFVYEVC